jgi:hypothetical protein
VSTDVNVVSNKTLNWMKIGTIGTLAEGIGCTCLKNAKMVQINYNI